MVEAIQSFRRFRDESWIKRSGPPPGGSEGVVRSVDLFAGCGGLSLGVMEACRRLKMSHSIQLATDWDERAISIFASNLRPKTIETGDIFRFFDGDVGQKRKTENERLLIGNNPHVMEPDLLTGGPPCQGHSDLNNHTRRGDPRNSLYLRMVRAAEIIKPKAVIIENVSTVIHSKEDVVGRAITELTSRGYLVSERLLWAHEFGVPQRRKRHFLVASKVREPDFSILDGLRMNEHRTLRWAIEDLLDAYDESSTYNSSAVPSGENQTRMNWLIENDEWDLPNHLRPPCHQQGHNYPAVYGRMRWDEPCSTITRGFGSTGQGRFMHPSATPGRTLTPHEAARVQTFPDWFDFGQNLRGTMSKTIGNAVPPLLAMHVSLVALNSMSENSLLHN